MNEWMNEYRQIWEYIPFFYTQVTDEIYKKTKGILLV